MSASFALDVICQINMYLHSELTTVNENYLNFVK